MPYVMVSAREQLDSGSRKPNTAGELNYLLTKLCLDFVRPTGVSYSVINEVVGVLECAKQEFLRRLGGPWEDRKCEENGDVGYGGLI